MKTVSAANACSDLSNLIDSTLADHEPVRITSERGNTVLVSEDDWRGIHETLHLVSIPGMRESILRGMAEPMKRSSRTIDL
ncbi:type II toxin-antitoxin system Phd/YefM family antitoxin [Luteolibacter sp. Populi]|uniref:type II toxin-antitoxin system Phd/YefM family antitoxin n=1 Tax=Luteolibacter sp. Populi TaxID=3230487 RepID=UPI003466933B